MHLVSPRSAEMQLCHMMQLMQLPKASFLSLQISLFRWPCKLVNRFQFSSFFLISSVSIFPGRVRLRQCSAGDGPTGFATTLDFLPPSFPPHSPPPRTRCFPTLFTRCFPTLFCALRAPSSSAAFLSLCRTQAFQAYRQWHQDCLG